MKISELINNIDAEGIGDFSGGSYDGGSSGSATDYHQYFMHMADLSAHLSRADRKRWSVSADRVVTKYVAIAGTAGEAGADVVIPANATNAHLYIQNAVSQAVNTANKDVAEVVLREGDYTFDLSGVTNRRQGYLLRLEVGNNVILRGENATLRLADNVMTDALDDISMVYVATGGAIISNLVIDGNAGKNVGNLTAVRVAADNVTVEGNKICDARCGVIVDNRARCNVERNVVSRCHMGLWLYRVPSYISAQENAFVGGMFAAVVSGNHLRFRRNFVLDAGSGTPIDVQYGDDIRFYYNSLFGGEIAVDDTQCTNVVIVGNAENVVKGG